MNNYHFLPFPNSYLLPLGMFATFIVVIIATLRWRRKVIGALALLSILTFIVVAAALPLSWNTSCEGYFGLGLSRQQSDGTAYYWGGWLRTNRGTVMLGCERERGPIANFGTVPYDGIGVAFHPDQHNGYVAPMHRFNLTGKFPWLQNLGFQILGGQQPPNPRTYVAWTYAIIFPHWFVLSFVCPAFPILWLRRRWKKRQQKGFPIATDSGTIRADAEDSGEKVKGQTTFSNH